MSKNFNNLAKNFLKWVRISTYLFLCLLITNEVSFASSKCEYFAASAFIQNQYSKLRNSNEEQKTLDKNLNYKMNDRFIEIDLFGSTGKKSVQALLSKFDSNGVSVRYLDSHLGWRQIKFTDQKQVDSYSLRSSKRSESMFRDISHLFSHNFTPKSFEEFRSLYNSRLVIDHARHIGFRMNKSKQIPVRLHSFPADGSLNIQYLQNGKLVLENITDLNLIARFEIVKNNLIFESIDSLARKAEQNTKTHSTNKTWRSASYTEQMQKEWDREEKINQDQSRSTWSNRSYKKQNPIYERPFVNEANNGNSNKKWESVPLEYKEWLTASGFRETEESSVLKNKWALYVLKLDKLPDSEVLRKHFKKMSLEFHPDRSKSLSKEESNGRFSTIKEAYKYLKE